ncbi:MAG: molybdopterin-guanine dinucleotide biosynthesis protein B [Deltaproteobacteria bacterium]|nr:molybdopterin-guanine dinucleotide biosynthesis protein B [Deltaproteobacteria bacterium]
MGNDTADNRRYQNILEGIPVLGICGYSGAGKTTLIEAMVQKQSSLSRRICVLKHDVHPLSVDVKGKDSFRIFEAGADVHLQNVTQSFFREHGDGQHSVIETIQMLAPRYDGFLLEGHKQTNIPHKIWLQHPESRDVPEAPFGFVRVLDRNAQRLEAASDEFENLMRHTWTRGRVSAALLIGGDSRRFGRPKHLMESMGTTWLEKTVAIIRPFVDQLVIIGKGVLPKAAGELPRLWDVPDAAGPIAGMRAAFRWDPGSSWVMMPCDLPYITEEAVEWLLSQRAVGREAVLPVLKDGAPVEPLFAFYDYRCGPLMERLDSPRRIADVARTHMPVVPTTLSVAWTNVNSPEDLSSDS